MTSSPTDVLHLTEDSNNSVAAVSAALSEDEQHQQNKQQQQQQQVLVLLPVGRIPTPLYLSCDPDNLPPYQVLLRRQIEFFEALESDVHLLSSSKSQSARAPVGTKQGRNKPIVLGQVGIRCKHCYGLTSNRNQQRTRGAVYYPSTLNSIYQASQNMASIHFLGGYCQTIPPEIKEELQELRSSQKASVGHGKAAWALKARAIGIYEDDDCADGKTVLRFYKWSDRTQSGFWPEQKKKTQGTSTVIRSNTRPMSPKTNLHGTKRKDRDLVDVTPEEFQYMNHAIQVDPEIDEIDFNLPLDSADLDGDESLGMIDWDELDLDHFDDGTPI